MSLACKVLLIAVVSISIYLAVAIAHEPGKRYALLVGVNSFAHPKLKRLDYPSNDAKELADELKKAGYQTLVLNDETGRTDPKLTPDKANIDRELKAVLDKCRPERRPMGRERMRSHAPSCRSGGRCFPEAQNVVVASS